MKSYIRRLIYWIGQFVRHPSRLVSEPLCLPKQVSMPGWYRPLTYRHYRVAYLLATIGVGLAGQVRGQIISTVAGSDLRGDGGPAVNANVSLFSGVAVDDLGNLYFADLNDNRIRKVNTQGIISTVAGNGTNGYSPDGGLATTVGLTYPDGVAVDKLGNLYFADYDSRIRRVSADGVISTIAGGRTKGFNGDGGPATAATLNAPRGMTVDGLGNLYFADTDNNRIRKMDAQGIISTVAGNGTADFSGDGGSATAATLNAPRSVAVDALGNLYIADFNNNRIRKVDAGGIISTVAGNGITGFNGDGGPATESRLFHPNFVAVDKSGNLYVADPGNNRIRRVDTGGLISTVAGNGTRDFSGDGGPATAASISNPYGVAVDKLGNLYFADVGNRRVRKVDTGGLISTVAGNGFISFNGDGRQATAAGLSNPSGVAVDKLGNFYIADTDNNRIRKVDTGGLISTVAGNGMEGFSGDGGPATSASLAYPDAVAVDRSGNLYFADASSHRIRKVDKGGVISTVAGNGKEGLSGDGGSAIAASLNAPRSVAVDGSGNLYFVDFNNNRIRKVDAMGIISTVAGNDIKDFNGDGGPATAAALNTPYSVAADKSGNLYIADYYNRRIRKVDTGGLISTVAGNGREGFSGDGGPAISATMDFPAKVGVDGSGNVYIADNSRIRKVNGSGVISTVAGNGVYGFSGDGKLATSASLGGPSGMAGDSLGNLYIADYANNRIRKVAPNPPPNSAPRVATAVSPQSATVGAAYSLSLASTFTDTETPNALTLTVAGLPASLSLNGTTISGTPNTTVGSPYTVTVTATDPGSLSASTTFTITVSSSVTTGPFAITGVTTVSCTASTSDQRILTFSPQYSGLSGAPVNLEVVSQSVSTTNTGPYSLTLNTNNPVITLKAVQGATVSSFNYDWLVGCNNGKPLSAEPVVPLYVKVMGNPIRETVDVEVSGTAGSLLDLLLTDLQGRPVKHYNLKRMASLERVRFEVGDLPAGIFLLQVTTPYQRQSTRILKQE